MVHSVGVSRKLGHRVTNDKVQGGEWGHGKRGGLGPVRWEDYMYCMVHSVGVSRKPDQKVSNGKVKGSGTWEEGQSGASQMGGHNYVTCMVHSVGVRRNKITGVLTVRLREWEHGKRGRLGTKNNLAT